MHRREFLMGCGAALTAASPKTVVLRSGWQTVNIGDIAHTPGVLRLLYQHLPGVRVVLWGVSLDRGVDPMLRRAFPGLEVASGAYPAEALKPADLLLHGSAPSVGSLPQFERWSRETGKPYGYFGVGVTLQSESAGKPISDELRGVLQKSAFVFTRETDSLANLRKVGIRGPALGFAPDGTFSFDLRDDARGEAFLRENSLEPGRFIAAIPRLRYTPYHLTRKVDWTKEETERRVGVNEKFKEADHAKLREAIIAYVRKTGNRVLLCAEMTYQLDVMGPLLYDPLPADVKPKVVRRRTYWLPDEAASVYRHASAVVSFECHSPIIAAAQGTPCMYIHQPEDGIKGRMWPDIGLKDWYFEVEETTGAALAKCVLSICEKPAAARAKVREALAFARKRQAEAMATVRKVLDAPRRAPQAG